MVRAVKTKAVRSLKKEERALLLPGPTGAEPWEVWIFGVQGDVKCVRTCVTPLDNGLRRNAALALPVSQVFCLPLWLNETDAKQFAGMISLQLELRGLQPRKNGLAVFDWTVVAQEGTRTLLMVGVLPSSLAAELQAEAYDVFDLSARYLSFPEDSLTLWKEQDRLAVAITRGRNLIYYQALSEGRITPRIAQDLSCIRATLTMTGILTPLRQVMLWTEAGPAELTTLQGMVQLPVNQAERPSPKAPSSAWKLTPVAVGEAKRAREVQRWQKRGFMIAFAVYLLVVAALVSRFFLTSHNVDKLRKWQSEHTQAIALVRDTRAAWKELRSVVAEKNYPLELLRQISESIPSDQLNLTLFEADNGHLLIKGEAKNAAFAFQFLDKLKNDPYFAGYTWEMGQPNMSANDLAKLQIEGTPPVTN